LRQVSDPQPVNIRKFVLKAGRLSDLFKLGSLTPRVPRSSKRRCARASARPKRAPAQVVDTHPLVQRRRSAARVQADQPIDVYVE
jgi:hypothetical protein